jgi:hypothetical protein
LTRAAVARKSSKIVYFTAQGFEKGMKESLLNRYLALLMIVSFI